MPLKAVLLDLGNTFYREDNTFEKKLSEILKNVGFRGGVFGYQRGYRFFGFRVSDTCEASLRALAYYYTALASSGRADPLKADELYDRLSRLLAESLHVIDGARRLLAEVKGLGLKIAVVSNASSHDAILYALRRDGLLGYVDALVTSALICVRKPDPRIFTYTLALLSVKPSEALFVGDRAFEDVYRAKNVGLRAVHLTVDEPPSPLADYAVSSLEEVCDIIAKLAKTG